jgi:site-specific recombinase XerD
VNSTLIRRTNPTQITLAGVPALFAPNPKAAKRFLEYFAANIRNANTRRAYVRAILSFSAWCEAQNLTEIVDIEPVHVAAFIEQLGSRLAKPSVKQHLAALRMLFDWLVVGQVITANPASPVRGPKYVVRKGKTAVLAAEEARCTGRCMSGVRRSGHGTP